MFRTTFLCQYVDMSDRNVIYIYILYILFTYFKTQDFLTDTSLLIVFLLEQQIHYSFVP